MRGSSPSVAEREREREYVGVYGVMEEVDCVFGCMREKYDDAYVSCVCRGVGFTSGRR